MPVGYGFVLSSAPIFACTGTGGHSGRRGARLGLFLRPGDLLRSSGGFIPAFPGAVSDCGFPLRFLHGHQPFRQTSGRPRLWVGGGRVGHRKGGVIPSSCPNSCTDVGPTRFHLQDRRRSGGLAVWGIGPIRPPADPGLCPLAFLPLGARGIFWVRGTVSQATYGKAPLWLTASQAKASSGEKSTGVPATTRVRSPHRGLTVIHRMQEAFLDQSRRLSPQGQILLPGLTLGVLGTDAVVGGSDPSVPQAYLSRVKDSYLNLGMMHLMAVSGSHFVLVSGLLGWILVRCQWRRKATGGIQALAFCLLAVCMYPSDSVIRALIMGLLAILALCRGRISSSFACLNLTVCLVLTFRPEFAWSYGFSLSVTAVYGIILFHRPCSAFLSRRLPGWLAQGLSMTICAQVLSLPISLLMQPSLPLLSPIANVMVAPFVEGATILGIAAFAIAWAAPRLAYALLWLGSGCTQVMNQISLWLADRPWCSLPWPQGLAGVGALFASYAVIILTYAVVSCSSPLSGLKRGQSKRERSKQERLKQERSNRMRLRQWGHPGEKSWEWEPVFRRTSARKSPGGGRKSRMPFSRGIGKTGTMWTMGLSGNPRYRGEPSPPRASVAGEPPVPRALRRRESRGLPGARDCPPIREQWKHDSW